MGRSRWLLAGLLCVFLLLGAVACASRPEHQPSAEFLRFQQVLDDMSPPETATPVPDAFEPDDSKASARPLAIGLPAQQHTLASTDDVDWFVVEVGSAPRMVVLSENGGAWKFEMYDRAGSLVGGGGSAADTGSPDVDSGGGAWRPIDPSVRGPVYVRVSAADGNGQPLAYAIRYMSLD